MPMLERYEATKFHRAMKRGFTSPFLISAVHVTTGVEEVLVVKSRAGYKNRQGAIFKEIFSTLLARELGIQTPEPVIVHLPEGFEFAAADDKHISELIKSSEGLNFATIHLGNDWKPWNKGRSRSISTDDLETIYSFDALIQNADRKVDNPNLQWKGDQVVALDFDRALDYVDSQTMDKAWRTVIAMLQVKEHVLHSDINHGDPEKKTGQDLWDSLEEWSCNTKPEEFVDQMDLQPPLNTLGNASLQRIDDYFTSLLRDPTDFFEYLTAHSLK